MKHIAIVCGGDSSEAEVSKRSAEGIYSFLDKSRYTADIVILKGADWSCNGQQIDKNDFSYRLDGKKVKFDFAYITIHGTPGENGRLQGYFDMIGMPYSCCDVLAAALTFNKFACNHYLKTFGYNIANSILLRKGETIANERVINEIGLPCFIKSNVGGSSFGCTKVKTAEQIQPAIERAFKEGREVIIEAYMKGTEVTSGVYKTDTKAVAFPITEVVSHREFFDYDAKYNGEVDEITPARIPDAVRDKIQQLTLRLYDIIGCKGIIRTDYIILENGQINLLEVNTTPGMTATSFIPQQVRAAGLEMKDVLNDIIG
ncbi:MAG: D-alanine--D-alanine ligase [Paludibacteraceae bacterium]|nr:D-alanine--D-alanine ligase [Paludibacteraceae bacterium]